jgi:hypothetical protein
MVLGRLRDVTRTALAWASIVDDVEANRLNIDKAQHTQAKKEASSAAEVVVRAARECFKWLLCPVQDDPAATNSVVEAFVFSTSSGTAGGELERVCKENELVIEAWSPIHLRSKLKEFYWKPDRAHVDAKVFWEDSLKYLYLPRLRSHDVLASVIRAGAGSRDFFATAFGYGDGKYEGFQFGRGGASLADSVLLIAPDAATLYESTLPASTATQKSSTADSLGTASGAGGVGRSGTLPVPRSPEHPVRFNNFRGTVEVSAILAKSRLNTIAEEVIALLASDPNATVRVTVEIDASFPNGASDSIKRGVSENATNLGFNAKDWE